MKKRVFFCIILLLLALVFVCFHNNIIEIANAIYLELQKAAAKGEDVNKFILSILTIGAFFIIVLAVLIFMLLPHPKAGLFSGFIFFLLFSVFVLAILIQVYKKEIANYLKSTYQPETHVTETK